MVVVLLSTELVGRTIVDLAFLPQVILMMMGSMMSSSEHIKLIQIIQILEPLMSFLVPIQQVRLSYQP